MELVLIRHAQPAWRNADGSATNDPDLTPLGVDQAAAVAARMAAEIDTVDGLFCTTAARSVSTARAITEATGMVADVEPWALEIGQPEQWEGIPEVQVVRELDALRNRPLSEWWDGSPGGETFRDFHERITTGVDAFLGRFGAVRHHDDPMHLWEVPDDGPRLVLVAHAGTNSVITSHLLGLDPQPWEWERFPCNHASITVLRSRPIANADMWALEHFSDVAHLVPDLVSA